MAGDPFAKVRRLPQTDEVWEGTARLARAWITPRDQAPYRPHLVMLMSASQNLILRMQAVEQAPTPEQVLDELLQGMQRPGRGAGHARRPAIIYLDDQALVEALAPRLGRLEVRCEYRRRLPATERALHEMERLVTRREPVPGLLKNPGVTPHLVGGLFQAAAFYYEQAPWRWLSDSHPLEVRYPPDGRPRYAVVMGYTGEAYGLAVYDSPHDLELLYSGIAWEQVVGLMGWFSLMFDPATLVPFDDLDDMERYSWPIAGELAYPIPVKMTRQGDFVRPGKSELLWLEAALLAVPPFVRDHMRAARGFPKPAKATLIVQTADGEAAVRLRYPAPGF